MSREANGLVVKASDSGSRGRGFEPHSGRHVVSGARGLRAPDRSGPQAPVTKLSWRLPLGVTIFVVAQWRIFFWLKSVNDKAGVAVANCSG